MPIRDIPFLKVLHVRIACPEFSYHLTVLERLPVELSRSTNAIMQSLCLNDKFDIDVTYWDERKFSLEGRYLLHVGVNLEIISHKIPNNLHGDLCGDFHLPLQSALHDQEDRPKIIGVYIGVFNEYPSHRQPGFDRCAWPCKGHHRLF